jgi:hypothetical protein
MIIQTFLQIESPKIFISSTFLNDLFQFVDN